jgi:hypothetical protein
MRRLSICLFAYFKLTHTQDLAGVCMKWPGQQVSLSVQRLRDLAEFVSYLAKTLITWAREGLQRTYFR